MQNAAALLDIAHQVHVREFNAFGTPLGTRAKDDRRHIVERDLLEESKFQVPGRENNGTEQVQNQGRLLDRLGLVLHIVDLVVVQKLFQRHALLLEFVYKGVRRDDHLDSSHLATVVHALGCAGVVQVANRFALDEER